MLIGGEGAPTMADGELRSQLPPGEIRSMYKTAINWLLSGSSLFGIPFYNWMLFVIAVVLLGIILHRATKQALGCAKITRRRSSKFAL
jgi:hypothetical protein